MANQNRRGLKKDFDPTKMLPGEFAVSIDSETENQIVWMCFAPGVVKRIATYEDFEQYLADNCKTAYEYAVEGGYAGTEDEFKAKMAQECADAIVSSASGAVIAVSDSAEQRLKRLLLHGKSTQDGTPSPSALVEIVNAGKYNEATGRYEVVVTVSDGNSENVQTVTITSDRPITKWDKLDMRNGVFGWAYKGLKLTIDGSGTWEIYNGDYAGFIKYSALPENMNRRDGYCNQLRIDVMGGIMQNGLWIGVNNNNLLYMINNDYYDSALADKGLANWKAHLNENPLIIWTYSDTETWVPLSQAEQDALNALNAYYPNTTITNDQSVTMEVDYVTDTKNYIDNKFTELQASILATGANV